MPYRDTDPIADLSLPKTEIFIDKFQENFETCHIQAFITNFWAQISILTENL